ncbi:hypothetical protein [Arthrobacter sp. UCD-GKA]|uniref:hypothetical protein n=1 Tax=Arthrobacter sp. UCD-GKA TaxID=1913576 RepID=UPI000B196557|nr:hypothetical protein [Arthrobacter sp. UCD-GKA]
MKRTAIALVPARIPARFPRILRTFSLLVAAGLCLAVGPMPAQAAVIAPLAEDPGPAGSFEWKGFNWQKRFWGGAPQFNRMFDPANVGNPDANGYVTLRLSNPTGAAPAGAEIQSTRQGFGYGTYSTTVAKNVSALQKEVVWGCLFTYDPEASPGYNEIDLCEASAWGGGAAYGENWPVTQGHGYWFDALLPPGEGNSTITFPTTTTAVLTHRLIWEPSKLTFETFAGTGFAGTLLKRTVMQGATVPVPANEAIHFNLWVTGGGGGDPLHVAPESVVIRDFSFAAPGTLTAPTPTISGTLATGNTLSANPGTWTTGTTLKYQWYRSGAAIPGATVKTYTLAAIDAGDTIKVRVTGTKTGYTTVSRYSAATAPVA